MSDSKLRRAALALYTSVGEMLIADLGPLDPKERRKLEREHSALGRELGIKQGS